MNHSFIHIVARSQNNAIGYNGQLLWHLKKDLSYFKEKTINNVCIVGRTTYDGIKHLKNRTFIVVTTNKQYTSEYDNAYIVHSIEEAITLAKTLSNRTYIIGGANIYKQTFKYANVLLITEIEKYVEEADSFYDYPIEEFIYKDSSDLNVENGVRFTFQRYVKI